jgi:hypothetical protein
VLDSTIETLWRIIDFLQTYNGAITALATVAVSTFTGVLVIVTRRQAILTKESVDVSKRALIDLERPYIFVQEIKSDVTFFLKPSTVWSSRPQGPRFSLSVFNYGRTPGNIEAAAFFFEVCDKIPDQITKLHITVPNPSAESVEIVIGQQTPFSFPDCKCKHAFTRENAAAINAGKSHLYCHGFFTYRDIFRNVHTSKFCRRYVPGRGEWAPEGGMERNSGS